MLIVALVLAVIGLTALVTAVVTSNEVVAWVCIAASSVGVILLVVDAIRERQSRRSGYLPAGSAAAGAEADEFIEYSEESGDTADEDQGAVVSESAETDILDRLDESAAEYDADDDLTEEVAQESYPDEVVHDEPEFDTYSDDEPDYPQPAEEAALHTIDESELESSDVTDPDGARSDER